MKDKHLFKILQALLIIVLVLSFYGCAAKSERSDSATAAPEMANEEAEPEAMQDKEVTEETEAANSENPSISTEVGYNRKMIKTGNLSLQTLAFKKCVEDIVEKVQSLDGYVESSNIEGEDLNDAGANRRNAALKVRIPQKNFDSFINYSNHFGNVVSLSSNSEDITSAYIDTGIRLKTFKIRHERLLALLDKSGSLEQLFEIEQELGNVTYEIEKLSGQLQEYDQLVDMGTIEIQIKEVYKIEETKPRVITFGDRVGSTFSSSIEGLKRVCGGLFLMVVALTPFLVIIIPITLIIVILIKRSNRGNRSNKGNNNNDNNN